MATFFAGCPDPSAASSSGSLGRQIWGVGCPVWALGTEIDSAGSSGRTTHHPPRTRSTPPGSPEGADLGFAPPDGVLTLLWAFKGGNSRPAVPKHLAEGDGNKRPGSDPSRTRKTPLFALFGGCRSGGSVLGTTRLGNRTQQATPQSVDTNRLSDRLRSRVADCANDHLGEWPP